MREAEALLRAKMESSPGAEVDGIALGPNPDRHPHPQP